MDLHGIALNFY